ncbi:probable low-specificity L-threonine aldolase 1 [Glycine soja]|uniref:probable low-specificity L-threonine aldolase 1 n=1 Tax=Glycine soja TaxID=3848 RepID=UPI00071930A0|nr:probable low-specificity L-threonine aldolase 1 [Glycine soja]
MVELEEIPSLSHLFDRDSLLRPPNRCHVILHNVEAPQGTSQSLRSCFLLPPRQLPSPHPPRSSVNLFSYIFFLLFLDGLNEIKGLRVDISSVETNIIYVEIEEGSRTTAAKLCKDLEDYGILLMPMDSSRLRIVFHHQISATDVQYALSCFQQAVNGVRNENGN